MPPSLGGDHAVRHQRRGDGAGVPSRRRDGPGGAVLGQPRRFRRHQSPGGQARGRRLARPRARQAFHGADASTWRNRGRREPARTRFPLDLFLRQCAVLERGEAARQFRPAHAGRGRDGPGDLHAAEHPHPRLGILGDAARKARRDAGAESSRCRRRSRRTRRRPRRKPQRQRKWRRKRRRKKLRRSRAQRREGNADEPGSR